MKTHFVVISCIVFLSIPMLCSAEVIERIVARVNGDIITLSEYEERLYPIREEARNSMKPEEFAAQEKFIQNTVLDAMIDELLMLQKAKEDNINVMDDEIEERLTELKKQNNITSEEQFIEALKLDGITIEEVKKEIRKQITVMRLRSRDIQSKIEISELDARNYYDENKATYRIPEKAHVLLILIELPASPSESVKSLKMQQAQKLVERIAGGEDFSKVAREQIAVAGSENKEDIGWVEKGKLLPEFEKVIFELPVGQVSEPFVTDYGINIVKVVERTPESFKPFESEKETIVEKLYKKRFEERTRDWVDELRKRAFIERKL